MEFLRLDLKCSPGRLVGRWSIPVSGTETENVGVHTGGGEIPGAQGILQGLHKPLSSIASTGRTPIG